MFRSFFMAGFECATGYNAERQWIDQIEATQHDRFVLEDYIRLKNHGISTIREGVRWPCVDKTCGLELSSLDPFLRAADEAGVEVLWDLFHYGYPDGLDLFSNAFPERFASYCYEVAQYISERTDGVCYFTPINEPSYFSWAAGEAGRFAPHELGRGFELKTWLAKAAIEGINAIWSACPGARIVNVDPICNVVAPFESPALEDAASNFNHNSVMQNWDMLCGRLLPELGGSREHLGIVGLNYYWTNQWELGAPEIPLADDDPRKVRLGDLVRRVYQRYGGDLLISETSHVGEKRQPWMQELTREIEDLILEGVPIRGVCIYPVLGMPEWHDQSEWTCMGLWDLRRSRGVLHRTPCAEYIDCLANAACHIDAIHAGSAARVA